MTSWDENDFASGNARFNADTGNYEVNTAVVKEKGQWIPGVFVAAGALLTGITNSVNSLTSTADDAASTITNSVDDVAGNIPKGSNVNSPKLEISAKSIKIRAPKDYPLMRVDNTAHHGMPAHHLQYGRRFYTGRFGDEAYDILGEVLRRNSDIPLIGGTIP